MPNRTPLITAIILLLLPVLYVGSYLALLTPTGTFVDDRSGSFITYSVPGLPVTSGRMEAYRVAAPTCSVIFWPVERINRILRPAAWEEWEQVQTE